MKLGDELRDKAYRQAYAESFADTLIATQIRVLRGDMSQAKFAELVGIKQSRVSAMEDENYSSWSMKTLKKLAAAKDVVFVGRFISFGQMLDISRQMAVPEYLAVKPFTDDPAFIETAAGPISTVNTGNAAVLSYFNVSSDDPVSLAATPGQIVAVGSTTPQPLVTTREKAA